MLILQRIHSSLSKHLMDVNCRVASIYLIANFVLLLLPGAELKASDAGVPSAAKRRVEIVYWYNPYRPSTVAATQELIAEFERRNPDIKVRAETIADDITTVSKLLTAVAAGSPPDVYKMDRFTVAERASAHLLEDLTRYIDKEAGLSAHYLPAMWMEVLHRDRVYALPMEADARVLFYRRDLLKQQKIPVESLDFRRAPISLDEITELSQRFNRRDKKGDLTHVGFLPWLDEGWHYTWGFANGAKFFDSEKCRIVASEPQLVRAFQWLGDWATKLNREALKRFLAEYSPPHQPLLRHPFLTGNIAFTVNGTWAAEEIRTQLKSDQWGMTWIPNNRGEKTTWSGGFALTIPKGARHPDAAWRFVRFAAGPDGQRILLRVAAELPTWKALYDEEATNNLPDISFFKELLGYAKSRPSLPIGGLYWEALTDAQKAVIFEGRPPAELLQEVEKKTQSKMNRYCSP